ncbi:winged helix-turn-helix domain-containing protein [Rheinheimera sp. FR7-31]|uniref:winged helix-turn-helix domain-containing protein n=1 Tax=Rheinheimera fenheensis TaxID=3152295 RepID=UPI00325F5211
MDSTKSDLANDALVMHTAGLIIAPQSQRVFYNGSLLPIKGLTYRLLETLVMAQQRAVSSEELAEKVWRKLHVSDETVAQRVSILRKALSFLQTDIIESVRSEGYRWISPVFIDESSALDSVSEQPVAPLISRYPTFMKLQYIIAAGLFSVGALSVYFSFTHFTEPTKSSEPTHQLSSTLQKAFEYAEQNTETGNSIAIDLFSDYLSNYPDSVEARVGLAAAHIERVVKFNGNELFLDFAAQQIDDLSKFAVPAWELLRLKGYYFDARGDIQQAIYYYEQAINANNIAIKQVAASLAYLYVRKGRFYEAMQLNLTVLNKRNGYTFLQIAEILYLTGLSEESKVWIETAYKFAPNDAFVAVQYARDASRRGEPESAYNALTKLHKFQSGTADSYIYLALLAINDSNWDGALEALDKANSLEPNSLYSQSLLYWLSKSGHIELVMPKPDTESATPVWPNWYIAKSIVEIADGDLTAARKSIAKAALEGYADFEYILTMPMFQTIKTHPDFSSLIEQMMHSVQTERTKIKTIELPNPKVLMLEE